jgi:hypothetical protein
VTRFVCTGRGTHPEQGLKEGVRYHELDYSPYTVEEARSRGIAAPQMTTPGMRARPPTVPGDSPSGRVPAVGYEYTYRCPVCRDRKRLTPDQRQKAEALPTVDVSYLP